MPHDPRDPQAPNPAATREQIMRIPPVLGETPHPLSGTGHLQFPIAVARSVVQQGNTNTRSTSN